jgi:uncharacterized protein YrrD
MVSTTRELLGRSIRATNGNVGAVDDVLFDDRACMVRHLVVDVGNWVTKRPLLVPAAALARIGRTEHRLEVNMTREQVMHCPGLDTDMPMWRQMRRKYWDVPGWAVLWFEGFCSPARTLTRVESVGDPHLRSATNMMGYHVWARDGDVGHVADFLVDDEVWCLHDFVVETGHWDHGRKVLMPPYLVQEVSWPMSTVFIDLPRDRIWDYPEFTPAMSEPLAVPVRRLVRT